MPWLAPPTIATFPWRPRSMSGLSRRQIREQGARVLDEHLLQDVLAEAEAAPVVDQPLVGEQRIVRAEHDLVLEAARDVVLEGVGEVFRRPAVQLAAHVGL